MMKVSVTLNFQLPTNFAAQEKVQMDVVVFGHASPQDL